MKKQHIMLASSAIICLLLPFSFLLEAKLSAIVASASSLTAALMLFIQLALLKTNNSKNNVTDESILQIVAPEALKTEEANNISDSIDNDDEHSLQQITDKSVEPFINMSVLAVYKAAFPELFASIVLYLNKTSEPISESLVKIKTLIANFQAGIAKSKDEYERHGQIKVIKDGIELLRSHIEGLSDLSTRSFSDVAKEISSLDEQMKLILNIVLNISDVAARIHVLSINASIEAARAGVHGRGFKVIADEVQKLSKETQSFVTTIEENVAATQKAFTSLHSTMDKNRKEIDRHAKEDITENERISETLDTQLLVIKELYAGIMTFVDSLQLDMNAFAPLGMLHAIITQEIENLDKVVFDLVSLCAEACPNSKDFVVSATDAGTERGISIIRKRLTTSRELDALEKALRQSGLAILSDLKRDNVEIEFF